MKFGICVTYEKLNRIGKFCSNNQEKIRIENKQNYRKINRIKLLSRVEERINRRFF